MEEYEPTLADHLIQEYSRNKIRRVMDQKGWVANTIASARKFRLDEAMSGFLADLGHGLPAIARFNEKRIGEILSYHRRLAFPPHSNTWIEYDWKASARRGKEQWGVPESHGVNGPLTHMGWLLLRHPKADWAVMAVGAARYEQELEGVPRSWVSPVAMMWSTTDEVPPWPSLLGPSSAKTKKEGGSLFYNSAGDMVLAVTRAPWLNDRQLEQFRKDGFLQDAADNAVYSIRFLWALLSAINDVPHRRRLVMPGGGRIVAGKQRPFVRHTVLELNLPKEGTRLAHARRILRAARRRGRELVRAHMRRHWMFPENPLCDHDNGAAYQPLEGSDSMFECKRCGGRKFKIPEHNRGDASISYTIHDYNVTHHKRKRKRHETNHRRRDPK
jgi:hypothetical protein